MMKNCSLLLFFLLSPILVLAQEWTLTGVVQDDTGEALPGVSVTVKGTARGVATDLDGLYSIKVSKGDVLVFKYVGYSDLEQTIADQKTLDVVLGTKAADLDEVVVVGYGVQSKRTVTSAISKLDGASIRETPINTVGEGLKGKIAGVRVYNSNNSPGSEATFLIRGGSSINGTNDPLILVDGVERSLAGLSPNDIESIEVLKDAASSAIYGSRASNGVVLVTTKKAKEGEIHVTFQGSVALQNAARMFEYMNARDQLYLARTRYVNGHMNQHGELFLEGAYSSGNTSTSRFSPRYLQPGESVPAGYQSMIDPIDTSKTLIFEDNDYAGLIFRDAIWQSYYAGIEGGTDKLNYTGSVNYTKDAGVGIGTDFDRFCTRANINAKLASNVKFNTILDYSKTNTGEYDNQYKLLSRGLMTPPTQRRYFVGDNKWYGIPTHGANASSSNPLFYEYYNDHSKSYNRLSVSATLDYEPIKGWHIIGTASTFQENGETDNFHKEDPLNGTRWADASNTTIKRNKLEIYSVFNKTFGNHTLGATAGYSWQRYDYRYLYAKSQGQATDKIPTLNAGNEYMAATSNKEQDVNVGFFGRLNYDYKKKYLFTLTFREDGSSRFYSGHQWGFFPGGSLGWVMSDEEFMLGLNPTINNLKWRVSYGQTGNNQVGLYDALGLYQIYTPYAGSSTIVSSSMPNMGLTWETSTQLDLGFDLGMFNNRIQLGVDYFNKDTDNLIQSKILPNTSGFSSVLTNIGKFRLRGFDLEINTHNITSKDFNWDSRITLTYVKNKVLKLPEAVSKRDKNRIGGYSLPDMPGYSKENPYEFGGIAEGEPLGRIYGYKTKYIITTQEQADNATYDSGSKGWDWTQKKFLGTGKKAIGDYEWCDLDQNGVINGNDMYLLGNTIPHTTGGFNNMFNYKDFTLNVYLDFALGHSIANGIFQRQLGVILDGNIPVQAMTDAWSPGDDPTKKKYAIWGYSNSGANNNYRENSDIFVQKADYLCIREISLSYSMPKKVIGKLPMENVVFTLQGNNLHYFTEVIGLSPEMGAASTYGSGYNPYPPIRKYSLSVKVSF